MKTSVIGVSYRVWCSIENCPFESRSVESLDDVFDLEDHHRREFGDHHRFEFERVED